MHVTHCIILQDIDLRVKLANTDVLVAAVTTITYVPAAGPTPPKVRVAPSNVSPVGSSDKSLYLAVSVIEAPD